jgi:hypothetical protein
MANRARHIDAKNPDAAPPVAQRRRRHRHDGQYQKAHGDYQKRGLMQRCTIARDFPKMHDDRGSAQRIARAHQDRPRALQGRVQQDGGQKAEHGKTRRHYQGQGGCGQTGPGQHHQGTQIPGQRQARRQPRQIAPLHSAPSPPAIQQNQEYGENHGAGRMPENINQQRLVHSKHGVANPVAPL